MIIGVFLDFEELTTFRGMQWEHHDTFKDAGVPPNLLCSIMKNLPLTDPSIW